MLCINDILACTVRLSNVTIDNGTVGCGTPAGLLIVSESAAIGRAKKSGFVEYALHSSTIVKSLLICKIEFVIIKCCKNLFRKKKKGKDNKYNEYAMWIAKIGRRNLNKYVLCGIW